MKKVVIIGGGFAGVYVARALEQTFEVTLIDTKNYFEFTPGILRTIVEPQHMNKIQVPHRTYLRKAHIIIGNVQEITKRWVRIKRKKIEFDYLVICTGSSYSLPIKEQQVVIATRARNLHVAHQNLQNAKNVLIIGGGLVGIELAGEIKEHYPHKNITLVHAGEQVIERNHLKTIAHASAFLKKRDVQIVYGERIIRKNLRRFVSNKGTLFLTDIAFLCTGITPNHAALKKNFPTSITNKNYVRVNDQLQLLGQKNIFAAGDITDRVEEKTAQNAERQAQIVVENIRRLEKDESLVSYHSKKTPLVISLGKWNGIFEYHGLVFTGVIPALLKWLIEKWEMWKLKRF